MNIESANVSTLASSSGTIVSTPQPLGENSVISEGFSGALVTQVGLLANIKTTDSLPLQAGLQDVKGSQVGAELPAGLGTQDFAALLGNDLPPSYKIQSDVDHAATLAAVTDTLKYIAMGATDGEKAAKAEQNIKDVIAMTVPVEQNVKNEIVVVEQSLKNAVAVSLPVEQITAGVVEQSIKDAVAMSVPVEQSIKDAVVIAVPVQMDLKRAYDKPDKKPAEGDAQITSDGTDGVLAAFISPVAMPVEQGMTANNLAPADTIEGETLLSFIKPSTGDAKSNQTLNAQVEALQNGVVVGQPAQGKQGQPVQDQQGFNLKYFENTGQTEKTGSVERQVLSIEGEKISPKIGTDSVQPNRPVADNKADVPAITKPLAHPEWNKDLGDRIVWMSSKAIPSAEIRLNPQHLGPISVRVNVADDQATVVFTAQHAATREAIEASIPKLREMMNAQQLNLADVNVSQGSASDQGRSQSQNFAQTAEGQGRGMAAVDGVDEVEQEIESGRATVSKGLLSIYA